MRTDKLSVLGSMLILAGTASAQAPPLLKPMPAAGAPPVTTAPVVQPQATTIVSEPMDSWSSYADSGPADWNVLRFNAEYLLWWTKKQQVQAPLVTGTSAVPPVFATYGGLAVPETTILAGAGNLDYGTRSGGRLTAALAVTDVFDAEISAFVLGQRTYELDFYSDGAGNPPLFRPVINMEPDPAFASPNGGNPVSFPGAYVNSVINIRSSSEFWGGEVNAVAHLVREPAWKVSALAGFRLLCLDEDLRINDGGTNSPASDYIFLGDSKGPGYRLELFDSFGALNHFYGGQAGVAAERQFGRLSIEAKAKLAMGGTVQRLSIAGSSGSVAPAVGAIDGPTEVVHFAGLLTTPNNIGTYTRSVFSVVPEINLNVGVDVFSWLRCSAGYTLLYWSNVIRPGDQVDLLVNQSGVPSSAAFDAALPGQKYPRVLFNQSDYWAHGLTFSAELRY